MIVDYFLDRSTRRAVFGPHGGFRFAVDLPPRVSPLVVTDSTATGVRTGDSSAACGRYRRGFQNG